MKKGGRKVSAAFIVAAIVTRVSSSCPVDCPTYLAPFLETIPPIFDGTVENPNSFIFQMECGPYSVSSVTPSKLVTPFNFDFFRKLKCELFHFSIAEAIIQVIAFQVIIHECFFLVFEIPPLSPTYDSLMSTYIFCSPKHQNSDSLDRFNMNKSEFSMFYLLMFSKTE